MEGTASKWRMNGLGEPYDLILLHISRFESGQEKKRCGWGEEQFDREDKENRLDIGFGGLFSR